MTSEEAMAIRFILMTSENTDKAIDNTHLMAASFEYAISQSTRSLMKDMHNNINNASPKNYVNPANYEPINVDTDLTQDSVDTVFDFIEGKVHYYYTETSLTRDSEEEVKIQNIEDNIMVDSQDELDLWEAEQVPHALIRLTEGQILEEFMLEEEIEFQGIGKCMPVE